MSGYNRNVCEHCGGDHVTRQCPDLEAGSSFAAPTGYAALTKCPCCGGIGHLCDPESKPIATAKRMLEEDIGRLERHLNLLRQELERHNEKS